MDEPIGSKRIVLTFNMTFYSMQLDDEWNLYSIVYDLCEWYNNLLFVNYVNTYYVGC
jgi:hypothetical protein